MASMVRTTNRLSEEMIRFKNEVPDFKNESQCNRKEMNEKWGAVINKLGSFAEGFVAPNIPRIAREQFGFPSLDFFARTPDKRNPQESSQVFEFSSISC